MPDITSFPIPTQDFDVAAFADCQFSVPTAAALVGLVASAGDRALVLDTMRQWRFDSVTWWDEGKSPVGLLKDAVSLAQAASAVIVGSWDASSGAFPLTRPDGSGIRVGDTWAVAVSGTTGGELFEAGDYLQALKAGGSPVFAGSWARSATGQIKKWRDEAQRWATENEDVPVETSPDQFSAKHHAIKSAASAGASASSAGLSTSEANRAEVARDDAQGVLPDRLRRDKATLLADTTLTYTAAQPGTVTAGDVIRTRAEGFAYEVAASGATDHHVETTGGVKLYVLPVGSDFYAAAFGIVGVAPDGSPFDERVKIATVFQAAGAVAGATGGISMVHFEPDRIYGITNLARRDCVLPAGVGFDLHGSTITRVGGIFTVPMIENDNTGVVGGPPTRDHHIRNGKLRGTGAPGAVSDQGSALLLFESVGTSFIENIETIDTNGDGLQFRNATVVMRDVVIGDYGRNGISPTSGDFVYENVRIVGNPIAGAEPGIGLDAENNPAGEFGKHIFQYIEATDMTFVDFYAPAGTEFRHEVKIMAGKIGGGARGLRFLAQNNTVANNVYIGSEVELFAAGVNGSCVVIDNVGGVQFYGGKMKVGGATGSPNGVKLEGTVAGLKVHDVTFDGAFSSSLLSAGATAVSGIDWAGCGSHPRVYLDNTTASRFENSVASKVTLANATTGNIFTADFAVTGNSWTLLGGATKEAQRIGYMLTEAEIDAEYGTSGGTLRFRGRGSFSAQTQGRITAFPNNPSHLNKGSEIRFVQPGSIDTGEIQFFTTLGSAGRTERLRINQDGHTHPVGDNLRDLGLAAFRWREIFAANSTINTSDEREKEQIGAIPDEWLDAWGNVEWSRFKWSASVEEKGEAARWHVGLIAQQIRDVFAARGIDAFEIGLLCHDEWEQQTRPIYATRINEETGAEEEYYTGEVEVTLAAGDRFGVRYSQAQAMEAAWLRRQIKQLSDA